MKKWFWERDDLYREDGKCCYLGLCGKTECDRKPEECETWENFFDGECQADEILTEVDC